MRRALLSGLALAAIVAVATPAQAQDVVASAPVDLSVTVYRDPYRSAGGFDLNNLNGFALVTETRKITIPPGQHRIRFEGVADGIEPASAIVTGLPSGVIEKNRDAALLSPSALVNSAADRDGRVLLSRTDPATGRITRTEGKIRSGAEGGVVVETPDGIEGLRCSGLPESFSFDATTTGLSPLPTLSVMTRTDKTIEAVVQLSYLSRGFDWAADYTANLATTNKKIDLGAWLTLANGNGTGFRNARVQVVAGRLNRTTGEVEPIDLGQPILARCWPQGSTSDTPDPVYIERAFPLGFDGWSNAYARGGMAMAAPPPPPPPAPMAAMDRDVIVTGSMMAEQENLGDLKLYRIPDRTTVSSRQSKQVRFMDRSAVSITKLYEAGFSSGENSNFAPLNVVLRTKNDTKNNLGLPLPSGRVSVFETAGSGAASRRLLAGETSLRDLAIDEETEIRLNGGANVQARHTRESRNLAPPSAAPPPDLKGKSLRSNFQYNDVSRIDLSNAQPFPVTVEIGIYLGGGEEIIRADRTPTQKNGRPLFTVTVPANDSLTIRYQTARPR